MISRKGSVDIKAMSDEEIAAINRERNAEHVSYRKKNDSAPSYLIMYCTPLQLTQLSSYIPLLLLHIFRPVRHELEKRNIYSH